MTDSWGNSEFANTHHRSAERGRKERRGKKTTGRNNAEKFKFYLAVLLCKLKIL